MLHLPASIAAKYRLATTHEVHRWSFGLVNVARRPGRRSWEQNLGTLDDERIFGPRRNFECPCGKYQGEAHRGTICDRCGVKVTTLAERRTRFGHIEFPNFVRHPLGDASDLVRALPVLPATFVESPAGGGLASVYEGLVAAVASERTDALHAGIQRLSDELLPVLVFAHEWALRDAAVLARGLVLEKRGDVVEPTR